MSSGINFFGAVTAGGSVRVVANGEEIPRATPPKRIELRIDGEVVKTFDRGEKISLIIHADRVEEAKLSAGFMQINAKKFSGVAEVGAGSLHVVGEVGEKSTLRTDTGNIRISGDIKEGAKMHIGTGNVYTNKRTRDEDSDSDGSKCAKARVSDATTVNNSQSVHGTGNKIGTFAPVLRK